MPKESDKSPYGADKKYQKVVDDLATNKTKLDKRLDKATELLSKDRIKNALKDSYDDFATLIRMLKAWVKGQYKVIPWKTLSKAILAVVYLISIIDFIPDFILGIGLMDDMTVILWVLASLRNDLKDFKDFENENQNERE